MDFLTYWNKLGLEGQAAFAISCKTSAPYLYLIAKGHKTAGPNMAIKIEAASGGKVSRSVLRSDLWPEQANAA